TGACPPLASGESVSVEDETGTCIEAPFGTSGLVDENATGPEFCSGSARFIIDSGPTLKLSPLFESGLFFKLLECVADFFSIRVLQVLGSALAASSMVPAPGGADATEPAIPGARVFSW